MFLFKSFSIIIWVVILEIHCSCLSLERNIVIRTKCKSRRSGHHITGADLNEFERIDEVEIRYRLDHYKLSLSLAWSGTKVMWGREVWPIEKRAHLWCIGLVWSHEIAGKCIRDKRRIGCPLVKYILCHYTCVISFVVAMHLFVKLGHWRLGVVWSLLRYLNVHASYTSWKSSSY